MALVPGYRIVLRMGDETFDFHASERGYFFLCEGGLAEEPLPPESPLWSHPRVVVTPHSSSGGHGRFARSADLFADNVRRYLAGDPLRHEVSTGP